jgi:hypothetical protein
VIASETGKAAGIGGDDIDRDYVEGLIQRLGNASGYGFIGAVDRLMSEAVVVTSEPPMFSPPL